MDKILTVNQKRSTKPPKTKKKQLKVVYITNPIKFKTSASEFRALVQELTGQDSDTAESARLAAADGVSGGQEEVAEPTNFANAHALEAEEVRNEVVENGPSSSIFGSFNDGDRDPFCGHLWHEVAYLDMLKSLDAM